MTPRLIRPLGVLAMLAALCGCERAAPIVTCEPAAGITPDCRFQNPEDLAPSPDGYRIIVSQLAAASRSGASPARAGSLVAYDPANGQIDALFPEGGSIAQAEGWGEVDCVAPDPALFAPHGIDIQQIVTGEYVLYAVNHGGRESVEMFEVRTDPAGIELIWRGCVVAPAAGNFNDLVVLRSGEFRVTQMFPADQWQLFTLLRMQLTGYTPGFAYHWSPANGFEPLPGSEVRFANGIEQSADERYIYLSGYLDDEVIRVDTETGLRSGTASVPKPDNLNWSPSGELLAASHLGSPLELLECASIEDGSCGFRFQIVAIDPKTMAPRTLFAHAGAPMGGVTSALPFGQALYLGTYAGDRIARLDQRKLDRVD